MCYVKSTVIYKTTISITQLLNFGKLLYQYTLEFKKYTKLEKSIFFNIACTLHI